MSSKPSKYWCFGIAKEAVEITETSAREGKIRVPGPTLHTRFTIHKHWSNHAKTQQFSPLQGMARCSSSPLLLDGCMLGSSLPLQSCACSDPPMPVPDFLNMGSASPPRCSMRFQPPSTREGDRVGFEIAASTQYEDLAAKHSSLLKHHSCGVLASLFLSTGLEGSKGGFDKCSEQGEANSDRVRV